jgi:signal transduction histidine kinase
LEDQELPDALREIVARLMRGSGLRVNLEVIGSVRSLPPSLSAELLRIAQEALTNALKHSGAAAVTVLLDYEPAGVCLSVVDDGRGFDAATVDGGFGLTSMRERAEKIGGSLVVSSEPGGGTRVECRVGSAA